MRRFPKIACVLGFVLLLSSLSTFAQSFKPYLSVEQVANSQIVLPPPPQPGSPEFLLDEYYFQQGKLIRPTERGTQAQKDAIMGREMFVHFAEAFGRQITYEEMPETYTLVMRSLDVFGSYATHVAKNHYMRTRPYVYHGEPSYTPRDDGWLALNGSYPSGHTATFVGMSLLLAEINPERQEQIIERGNQGGFSRVIVGVHWWSDVQAGKLVAAYAYARLHADDEFNAQMAKAKAEFARIKGN